MAGSSIPDTNVSLIGGSFVYRAYQAHASASFPMVYDNIPSTKFMNTC